MHVGFCRKIVTESCGSYMSITNCHLLQRTSLTKYMWLYLTVEGLLCRSQLGLTKWLLSYKNSEEKACVLSGQIWHMSQVFRPDKNTYIYVV